MKDTKTDFWKSMRISFIFTAAVVVTISIGQLHKNAYVKKNEPFILEQVKQLEGKLNECQASEIECWASLESYAKLMKKETAFEIMLRQHLKASNEVEEKANEND